MEEPGPILMLNSLSYLKTLTKSHRHQNKLADFDYPS